MDFDIVDLGLTDFKKAWAAQNEIFDKVKTNSLHAALILCRHHPVITLGRSAKKENIKAPLDELQIKKIPVYAIERGGDVTYHGPGQLTAYPIFNLALIKKDIHQFLRRLEDTAVNFLSELGIEAVTHKGITGVWIGQKKIASIGIAVKNWITFHGMSINIKKDDLDNFRLIRPCGMDIEATCVETAICKDIDINTLKENLIQKFKAAF